MSGPGPLEEVPRWQRVMLGVLAVSQIPIGLWAVLAPQNWFDEFPGWSPALVAAHPPYNEHLATDAGAGLLLVGVLAGIAAWDGRMIVVRVCAIGILVFALPHFVWHLANPSDLLTSSEDFVGTAALGFAVVAAAIPLWASFRSSPEPVDSDPTLGASSR